MPSRFTPLLPTDGSNCDEGLNSRCYPTDNGRQRVMIFRWRCGRFRASREVNGLLPFIRQRRAETEPVIDAEAILSSWLAASRPYSLAPSDRENENARGITILSFVRRRACSSAYDGRNLVATGATATCGGRYIISQMEHHQHCPPVMLCTRWRRCV